MSFLQKSNSEYAKIEKPVVVTNSYEGLDKEEDVETVMIIM